MKTQDHHKKSFFPQYPNFQSFIYPKKLIIRKLHMYNHPTIPLPNAIMYVHIRVHRKHYKANILSNIQKMHGFVQTITLNGH